MKFKSLFVIPLISVMLFSCKRGGGGDIDKGGKKIDTYEAISYAPAALRAFSNQSAIGFTLTGSVDYQRQQSVLNYDENYDIESIGYIYATMGLSKVNIAANVKDLDMPFKNAIGSATASATFTADFKVENVKNAPKDIEIDNMKKNISGNAYLSEGVLYMDHNQDFADAVNAMAYSIANQRLNDSAENKYYYTIPGTENFVLTSYLREYVAQNQTVITALSALPAMLGDRLTAKKYSDTRYGLFLEGDFFEIATLFGMPIESMPHVDTKETSKVGIIYNTTDGIEAIQLKLRVAYHQTIEEHYGQIGGQYYPQFKDQLYLKDSYSADLTLKATYGKSVKVNTLKDKSEYTISLGGEGGSKPGPGVFNKVEYDEFLKYVNLSEDIRIQANYENFFINGYLYSSKELLWQSTEYFEFPLDLKNLDKTLYSDEMISLLTLYNSVSEITTEMMVSLYEEEMSTGTTELIYLVNSSNNHMRLEASQSNGDALALQWDEYGYLEYLDLVTYNGEEIVIDIQYLRVD